MNQIDTVLQNITQNLREYFQITPEVDFTVEYERTSNIKFGDFSTNIALKNAKNVGRAPIDLAQDITEYLINKQIPGIQKIEYVKPGFINIFFDTQFLQEFLNEILTQGSEFGKNKNLAHQKWIVEHTSPNPNKAMHLGHLRNNLVGMGIVRVLQATGAEVISDNVYNDRGIAIAKVMYGFLAHMKKDSSTETSLDEWIQDKNKWYTPEEKNMKPDVFVTECYILGEKDFKSNTEIEQYTRDLVVKWENNDSDVWELWKHVLAYAYKGIEQTLHRLGSHWDKIWYEHEHYQKGKDFVEQGLQKGVFKTLEDGAVLTHLEPYNISDTILLKKDGTSLYITQDIALTSLKKTTYNADKLVWVIGPEQSTAMKQLFAVCEQLGIGAVSDFTHVPYGYVGLKGEDGGFKKMSSRDGTVVLIDDVIDEAKQKIKQRFIDEKKDAGKDLEHVSEVLALGAVKFSILRSDRTQDLIFDINQSINVNGDSGVYVMYSYVRTQSILKKSGQQVTDSIAIPTQLQEEEELLRSLLFYPDVIKRAGQDFSVHHIAQYLLELASAFNSWYGKEMIVDGSEREGYKLALTKAVGITIQNGLALLGIDVVEEI